MTRHHLRAARALLLLRQEVLAEKAGVGVATIRRFENGVDVGDHLIDALRRAIEAEGAILVAAGTIVAGRRASVGVLLRSRRELPEDTRQRLAAVDASPDDAAEATLHADRRGKVGRRARIPHRLGSEPKNTLEDPDA